MRSFQLHYFVTGPCPVSYTHLAEEAHRASRAEYLPSIGVNGDYGVQGINPNKGASVFQASATVTIPIFQSGRVKADVDEADACLLYTSRCV